jgi:hypothetical protein
MVTPVSFSRQSRKNPRSALQGGKLTGDDSQETALGSPRGKYLNAADPPWFPPYSRQIRQALLSGFTGSPLIPFET